MADCKMEERKYLHEFSLKSCKFATKMSDLTKEETNLWRKFLEEQQLIHDDIIDLFDNEEEWDGHNEDIRVMYFEWKHNNKIDILLDMNAWPGDNESGFISINGKMVLKNSDQYISALNTTSEELKSRIKSYQHIRIQYCTEEEDYDNNHSAHKSCELIRKQYDIVSDQYYKQRSMKY